MAAGERVKGQHDLKWKCFLIVTEVKHTWLKAEIKLASLEATLVKYLPEQCINSGAKFHNERAHKKVNIYLVTRGLCFEFLSVIKTTFEYNWEKNCSTVDSTTKFFAESRKSFAFSGHYGHSLFGCMSRVAFHYRWKIDETMHKLAF